MFGLRSGGRCALCNGVVGCWQFLKMIEPHVNCNGLATEEPEIPCFLQTLVIHRRRCKSWSLSSQLCVSVRDSGLLKVVCYYFFYSSLGHFIFRCKPHEWLCRKIVFWGCISHCEGCLLYIYENTAITKPFI